MNLNYYETAPAAAAVPFTLVVVPFDPLGLLSLPSAWPKLGLFSQPSLLFFYSVLFPIFLFFFFSRLAFFLPVCFLAPLAATIQNYPTAVAAAEKTKKNSNKQKKTFSIAATAAIHTATDVHLLIIDSKPQNQPPIRPPMNLLLLSFDTFLY